MDPTSFRFTVTLPGDAQLLDAIRDLTAHAAGYAQLEAAAASAFVARVVDAARDAFGARAVEDPVAFAFDAGGGTLRVTITAGPQSLRVIDQPLPA